MAINSASPNRWVTSVALTVVLGGLSLGFLGCWQKAQKVQADMLQLDQSQIQNAGDAKRLVELTRQAELLQVQVQDYDRLVPDNKNLGDFLGQLSAELEKAGLQSTAVKAQTATVLGKCERLPIEVHAMGSYDQIHSFLQCLESMQRKSSVSRLEIVTSDPGMSGLVTLDLTLSIYSTHQK